MNRTLNVMRMQLINKQTFLWVPLMVLGGAFVISLLIYAIIPTDEPKYGGGAQAPLWYFGVIGIQALTLTFPFSQALSIARKTYYLGTLLTAAAAAVALATFYTALKYVELATGGWGINGYFFVIPWISDGAWYEGWTFFFAWMMLFFVFGFWAATIYKRWGSLVTTTVLVGLGLALVGVIALITWQQWWPSVGGWFASQTSFALGLWGIAVVAVLAASSFLTLRRAIP